jgi:hypothetical protein
MMQTVGPTIINLDAHVNKTRLYFKPKHKRIDLAYPEWLLNDTLAIEEIFWENGWSYRATFSRPFNLEMLNQILLNFKWKTCVCLDTRTIEEDNICPELHGHVVTKLIYKR